MVGNRALVRLRLFRLASLLAGAAVDRRDRVGVLLACHLLRAPAALAAWRADQDHSQDCARTPGKVRLT